MWLYIGLNNVRNNNLNMNLLEGVIPSKTYSFKIPITFILNILEVLIKHKLPIFFLLVFH